MGPGKWCLSEAGAGPSAYCRLLDVSFGQVQADSPRYDRYPTPQQSWKSWDHQEQWKSKVWSQTFLGLKSQFYHLEVTRRPCNSDNILGLVGKFDQESPSHSELSKLAPGIFSVAPAV